MGFKTCSSSNDFLEHFTIKELKSVNNTSEIENVSNANNNDSTQNITSLDVVLGTQDT